MVKGFTKNGKFRPTGKKANFSKNSGYNVRMVNGKFVAESLADYHKRKKNKMIYCAKCGIDFTEPPSKKNGTTNICYSCYRKSKSKNN